MMADKSTLTSLHYWGLSVLSLAVFLVAGDFTAFSPALPAIAANFSSNFTSVHWVINAYSLTYGVIIVTGGRLADVYGRRRLFIFGVIVFALSSLVGGLAQDLWVLLLCRALMGFAGALIWSAILGMAYNLLPPERAGLAGGLILAALGLSTSLGPILGGFFSEYLTWRWVLFVNIPLAFIIIFLCCRKYPADEVVRIEEDVDYLGALLLSVSLFCFLLAMEVLAQKHAFGLFSTLLLCSSMLFLVGFGCREISKGSAALIPVELIKDASFLSIVFSVLLVATAFFAVLVYIPLLFIKVHKYSALMAGVALLPMMVSSSIFSFVSGLIHEKCGARLLICSGALGMSVGLYWLSVLNESTSYVFFIPGLALVGASLGVYSPAAVTAAVALVDPSKSSLAGGIVYMFRFLGGALALGFNAIILAYYDDIAEGVYRIFEVDAFITFLGFLLPLYFLKGVDARFS
ncbi:MFS transporter [Microbulbifer variabilis]|uniref:MFS transporter n=1 Tax=Microbulbifer variabilis TaxID=266805 RepID=A0ABY4V775_9GAMM|nr:MFS transporter [Microbulbifer variabilis]USD20037.1 MFS transporter [Microbulbifer variabilis]